MIDSHCHLTFPDYRGRVADVLASARDAGVVGAITIATTPEEADNALACAIHYGQKGHNLWCSSGVHPLYADRAAPRANGGSGFAWDVIRRVAAHERCVAWGELGLDNHYKDPPHDIQRRVLDEQLAVIADSPERPGTDQTGKPIVVHCRDAFDDLIPVLESSGLPGDRFVFHCFTAGPREMEMVLALGAHVSFTGVLTYPNAPEVREAAALAPLDRVMVETDAPFLSPQPVRKARPNEPRFVVYVAQTLATIHNRDLEDIHATINATTERFFKLPPVDHPRIDLTAAQL